MAVAARIDTTTFARPPTSLATSSSWLGLVAEHEDIGPLGELGVRADRLAAQLLGERCGLGLVHVVHEHRLADAARERGRHVPCSDETQLHCAGSLSGPGRKPQDWLKKPFSISRARSSAETSTLRGVSRNTLSAIRCMPPSSA